MRRLAHSAVLVTVLGMAAFALTACGASGKKVPVPPRSARVGALIVAVPGGFIRTEIRGHGQRFGALFTDYRVTPGSPTLRRGVFPANGVALLVGRVELPAQRLPTLRLPVTLNELRGPQRHANGTAWNGVFSFHDSAYTISYWAGRTAPSHDRAAVESALASIRHAR